jgi:hypothetical protein
MSYFLTIGSVVVLSALVLVSVRALLRARADVRRHAHWHRISMHTLTWRTVFEVMQHDPELRGQATRLLWVWAVMLVLLAGLYFI